jgi:UDP:flavonoid glycosyltransferase YjiC (YdhE family)
VYVGTLPAQEMTGITPPQNARVFSFIPHAPILERAAWAITHAGMGATQKALAHAVPVCTVPFGRDQLEVARCVEVGQAGTRLPASRLRADRLRRTVREAMQRADGAKRVAAAFAAAGGATAAADAFEANLDHEVIARVRARVEATRTRVSDEAILEARNADRR